MAAKHYQPPFVPGVLIYLIAEYFREYIVPKIDVKLLAKWAKWIDFNVASDGWNTEAF